MEEFAIDVAREQIGGGDRHDGCRHQGADPDGREGDAGEPGREIVQEQRRHREIVLELAEPFGEFRQLVDSVREGEKAKQRQKPEHESIGRQQSGVAAHRMPAGGAEDGGHRVRVKQQGQRRA